MGAEVLLVKCFQLGGVAIISSLVESGLESMDRKGLANVIKTITLCGIGFMAFGVISELFNYIGGLFL